MLRRKNETIGHRHIVLNGLLSKMTKIIAQGTLFELI